MNFFSRLKTALRPIDGAGLKVGQQPRPLREHGSVFDPGTARSSQHNQPQHQQPRSSTGVILQANEASTKPRAPMPGNAPHLVGEAAQASRLAPVPSRALGASSNTQHQLLPTGITVDVPQITAASTRLPGQPKGGVDTPQPREGMAANLMDSPAPKADDELDDRAKRLAGEVASFINDVNERFGKLRLHPPSDETLAEYSLVRRRIRKLGEFDVSRFRNSNTKQKIRAAFIWVGLHHAENAMNVIRELTRKKRFDEAIAVMQSVLAVRDILAKFDSADPIGEADQNTQQRDSKRKLLPKLPQNWESTFIDAIRRDAPEWYLSACVMLSAGARPAEVRQGAMVSVCENGNLVIKIQSAKQGSRGDRSVGLRTIEVTNDSAWTLALVQAVQKNASKELSVIAPNPKHASQIFSRISRECGLPANAAVVPYVLRHRFGALVKSSGLTLLEQAAAMGHGSTCALSNYGVYNNRINRGGMPVRVVCERQPRLVTRKSEIPSKASRASGFNID